MCDGWKNSGDTFVSKRRFDNIFDSMYCETHCESNNTHHKSVIKLCIESVIIVVPTQLVEVEY
jgi:hypothetical protein